MKQTEQKMRLQTMETKMVLVIKARTEAEAKHFAQAHNIQITDICDMGFRSYRGRTPATNALAVQKWYNEDGECEQGNGYPLGTLLYFNFGV
jgi:hypothetical protein